MEFPIGEPRRVVFGYIHITDGVDDRRDDLAEFSSQITSHSLTLSKRLISPVTFSSREKI